MNDTFDQNLKFAMKHLLENFLDLIDEIWLFGSYARRDNHKNSDIDLFIVLKDPKFNTLQNKRNMINICDPLSGPEIDFILRNKSPFEYKDSDFQDYSEKLFIKNVKKDGLKLWPI
ncbi:MAG: nucleotidyltransferase domain-containing protein [Ruminiclostridium sp.]|nr:nucleotidyltransferase domain-containing protein [Ruminiclostridium sp.]